MNKEEALAKAKSELALDTYFAETSTNAGLVKIHTNRAEWLSILIALAEKGLYESVDWKDCSVIMPENLPENEGRKSIPCLVCVKSRYPNGKPNIEKRMRQMDTWFGNKWSWSKLRGDDVLMWAPMPYPKNYKGD